MRRLCDCVLLWVYVLVWCVALSAGQGENSDVRRILNRFPRYHVLTLEERNDDARTFIRAHFPKHNPSIVHADFDGDGHPDYAVLLKDKKSGTTKFVISLCPGDTECKTVHEVDVTPSAGAVYIRPVRIGSRVSQTDAIETNDYPSPVRLSSPGIELTYFEQAKMIYYWNKKHKKIEGIQTAD